MAGSINDQHMLLNFELLVLLIGYRNVEISNRRKWVFKMLKKVELLVKPNAEKLGRFLHFTRATLVRRQLALRARRLIRGDIEYYTV